MSCRTDSSRLRRALIALALILGHGVAMAAMPACALTHAPGADAVLAGSADLADSPRTGAADTPTDTDVVPHDHGPDAPSVPAAVCAAPGLAAAAPAVTAPPPELPGEATATDARIPPGTETPPPFQPPRV